MFALFTLLHVIAAGVPRRKTRGPVTGKALMKAVSASGRVVIETGESGSVKLGQKTRMYSGQVGSIIRDRVPVLWRDWSLVPQCVKDNVNNAMSVS